MDPLTPEILLSIFSRLDLSQVAISRRICKDFLEVIENNKLLWRDLEWIRKNQESLRPTVDVMDEKSKSTIESVSIEEQVSKTENLNIEKEDLRHLIQVLHRSGETLRHLSLRLCDYDQIQDQALELASSCSRLQRFILCGAGRRGYEFPHSRLVPRHQEAGPNSKSTSSQLQLLWVAGSRSLLERLDLLKSLVSFAQGLGISPQLFRRLTSNFSETIVHMRVGIARGATSASQPIFCPNLRVFEGFCLGGLSTFFNAPKLQIVVFELIAGTELEGIPSTVEKLWLQSTFNDEEDPPQWQPLSHSCPNLKVLRLTEEVVSYPDAFLNESWKELNETFLKDFWRMLENREKMVQEGKEIDGIKFNPLQKLILPFESFDDLESIRAQRVVGEIIDVKSYPDYIHIEY